MDLRLIYVNKIGFNFKGNAIYEFIFTDANRVDLDNVYGDGWEEEPASGMASPPDDLFVFALGRLEVKNYELDCIGDNEFYSVFHAKDGVIALAFELIDDTFTPIRRLCFHYGDTLESVNEKLRVRKFTLDMLSLEEESDDEDDYEEYEEEEF